MYKSDFGTIRLVKINWLVCAKEHIFFEISNFFLLKKYKFFLFELLPTRHWGNDKNLFSKNGL